MAIEQPPRAGRKSPPQQIGGQDVSKLRALPKWRGPPITLEEMQAAIEISAVARYRRATGAKNSDENEA